jgi:hypothetical protein
MRTDWTTEYTNFWRSIVSYVVTLPAYDDQEQGLVSVYRRPASHAGLVTIQTDDRGLVSVALTGMYERDLLSKQSMTLSGKITFRPAPWMEIAPTATYWRVRGEDAWLFPDGTVADPGAAPAPFSVFGRRDLDYLDINFRGIVTFTRSLTLQFFSQLQLARGKYADYKRLTPAATLVPYDYASFSGFTDHDFNEATVNANVLLRWEYLPGSSLYLVWTQGRYDALVGYAPDFSGRFHDAFALPHEDVLLLKFSHWFSL